ncbi:MAG: helix-turn-helix domain-containing protein [Nitrososphaerota archaeon]|nr:helix-turn-helix domain-containing protein [Nitrososphaerota archaeon]
MEGSSSDAVAKIAGNVVSSPDAGRAMKAWREKLGIKQKSLADSLHISASVLSDYESGRRPSPGVKFVRKYIEALVTLDEGKGRVVSTLLSSEKDEAILSIGEFSSPIEASRVLKLLDATVLTGSPSDIKLYGYTVVDSIKTIYALSGYDFYRIFGATTERALVFTKVGMGRSPLVAIRVSQLKPRVVIIHGPREVDPLAVDLARREGLVLALSGATSEEAMIAALRGLLQRSAQP